MRRLATGLLILMACTYVISRTYEDTASFWLWVKAFSEAAMVGALADWFAVTALFRHPLGLPIPHTAIVKKEKERIGAAVASFVRKSFLMPEEVSRQWSTWRPVSRLVGRLSERERAGDMLRWFLGKVPGLLQPKDRETLAKLGAAAVRKGVSTVPMGRVLAVMLEGFLKSPGRRDLIAPILRKFATSAAANREWVMEEASRSQKKKRLKVMDFLGRAAASAVSGKAVEKFSAELLAASENQNHKVYDKIEEALRETVEDLRSSDGGQWESLKERIVEDPEAAETLTEVVETGITMLADGASELEKSEAVSKWSEEVSLAAERLLDDRERLKRYEEKAGELAARFSGRYGENVEKLIHRTVQTWEADELIARIENQVGSDLQFIRVNGTLIGGLVGLLLHGIGLLIWG